MATRKPMTFDIDDAPKIARVPLPPAAAESGVTELRKAVGARVPVGLYREAKAHAALAGITVQEVVEVALRNYLAKTKQ